MIFYVLPELENSQLVVSFWKINQVLLQVFMKFRAVEGLLFHDDYDGQSSPICVTAIDVKRQQQTNVTRGVTRGAFSSDPGLGAGAPSRYEGISWVFEDASIPGVSYRTKSRKNPIELNQTLDWVR